MKNRFFLFSLLSTVVCVILYHVILREYFNVRMPLLPLVLYAFLPVILVALIIHLYLIILAFSPLEKFFSRYFPDHEGLHNINWLTLWKNIIADNQAKLNELEILNHRYRSTLNHLEEGILIIDDTGKILYDNLTAREILHFHGTLKDKYYWEVMQNLEIKNLINLASEKCQKQTGDYVLHSPLDRSVAYTILPIDEPFHSKPDQLLIVLTDISKIKKLEKIRTDFVANVSHELKSPLGAILGYVETLADEPGIDQEKRKKYLNIIHKNGIQLNAIVDDLLILSKLESDKNLELTRFNPYLLLLDIIELYADKITDQKQSIDTQAVDPSLTMLADKWKIRQLMINLLDNAIKYSKMGGKIELSLFLQEKNIVFSVSDHGIGIPILEQDRVFERFYRVDKARSSESSGTGLGLSIVKHIVDLHHGTITLTSARNEGSSFTVRIPEILTQS